MTDEELDRLDALAQAATPGPWEVKAKSGIRPVGRTQNVAATYLQVAEGGGTLYPFAENAAFIAASRTAIPALIAEIRRLRAQIDGFQGLVNEARRWSDRPGMRWK